MENSALAEPDDAAIPKARRVATTVETALGDSRCLVGALSFVEDVRDLEAFYSDDK